LPGVRQSSEQEPPLHVAVLAQIAPHALQFAESSLKARTQAPSQQKP
jgi:hypothetical protein